MGDHWTKFTRSAVSRVVYASSTRGSDANDGGSYRTPVQTLARAVSLLRHGFPDWLLLRQGDAWLEGLGHWKLSGRSRAEPMVISTYGTHPARPVLHTGAQDGMFTQGGGGSPPTIDYLAVVGLRFDGSGEAGLRFLQPGEGVLIEDCLVEGYQVNVALQGFGGRLRDFALRRCVVVDSNGSTTAHSQGLYAYGVDGLLVEQCLFDRNGHPADIYSHDVYFDNGNTGCKLLGNIISRASSHGAQMRSGGVAHDNLFVRCPIALLFGGGNNPELGGVEFEARGNVVAEGTNIDGENPRGWGILLRNVRQGLMEGNLVAHSGVGAQPLALSIDGDHRGEDGALDFGVHDVRSERNVVFDWPGIEFRGNVSGIEQVDDNFNLSTGALSPKKYPAPRRSVASYCRTLLPLDGDFDRFMFEARRQGRTLWRPRFTARAVNRYLREGFEMAGPGPELPASTD